MNYVFLDQIFNLNMTLQSFIMLHHWFPPHTHLPLSLPHVVPSGGKLSQDTRVEERFVFPVAGHHPGPHMETLQRSSVLKGKVVSRHQDTPTVLQAHLVLEALPPICQRHTVHTMD